MLTRDEIQRYGRQILLPWWSGAAQARLRVAHAHIAAAALREAPVAMTWAASFLLAAGLGELSLEHDDTTSFSFEQAFELRVLGELDVAQPRAATLAKLLAQRAPHAQITLGPAPAGTRLLTFVDEHALRLQHPLASAAPLSSLGRGSAAAAHWLRTFAAG